MEKLSAGNKKTLQNANSSEFREKLVLSVSFFSAEQFFDN